MSDEDTMPFGFNASFQALCQKVRALSDSFGALSRQSWIQEQEVMSLKFEVHALRLRILELEEEKRKGLAGIQSQS